jgi:bla regulator protein blaR1
MKDGYRIKIRKILCILFIMTFFTSCVKEENMKEKQVSSSQEKEETNVEADSIDEEVKTDESINEEQTKEVVVDEVTEDVISQDLLDTKEVDFSEYFEEIKGSAVFYNDNTNQYQVYNKELCETRTSPCSTFKIISTLMGLESKVIDSKNATMGYDGTIYSIESWNKDVTLQEAFSQSCVWYYRKLIDKVGQNEVQNYLDKLQYGNQDSSEWNGSGMNLPELSGFWLESSLEISPIEQVTILADIFEKRTEFSDVNIDILKDIMLVQSNDFVEIYGKTGTGKDNITGKNKDAWFVGMTSIKEDVYYFAVRLDESDSRDITGADAKEIVINIIEDYYTQ